MAEQLSISDVTTDFEEFVTEFNSQLNTKSSWKGNLTTQTSQTLVDLVSTLGTFMGAKLLRYYEDSFPATVQSDGSIRAISTMQGLRLTRKLPAGVPVSLVSEISVSVNAFSQFNIGGYDFFNREQLVLEADVPLEATLYQGTVNLAQLNGLGTEFQVYMPSADNFAVSDQDVVVAVNQVIIPKALGGLWNYKNEEGYSDLTHPDGRLMVQFGNASYGTVPQVNDTVAVLFVTTMGYDGNALTTKGSSVVLANSSLISGTALANPTGGGNEKNTLAYKNIEAGAFGTYSSAVTRNQYWATVNTYPGIVDAVIQAQREINPQQVKWMNVIRVTALTSSPWLDEQKKAFCKWCQDQTMYSPYFLWQDAVAVPRDLDIEVYCFNTAIPSVVETKSEAAVRKMLAPQPGILQTNHYPDDFAAVIRKANNGAVAFVKVIEPTEDLIVTAPPSPEIEALVVTGAGSLTPLVYAYGISIVTSSGEEGSPSNWVFPQLTTGQTGGVRLSWEASKSAVQYKIWGRKAGSIGLLVTLPATELEFLDDGSIVPDTTAMADLPDLPIRYNQIRNLKIRAYFAERQQRFDN